MFSRFRKRKSRYTCTSTAPSEDGWQNWLPHGCFSPVPPPPFARISMDIRNIDRVPAFTTKDGSEIRELLAHRNSCIRNQTLAEARLAPGLRTAAHYHARTEEIYYIIEGQGRMEIDEESREVEPGDAIAIPPGARHQIANPGPAMLKFLCCCAPGYEHEDTVLLDSPSASA